MLNPLHAAAHAPTQPLPKRRGAPPDEAWLNHFVTLPPNAQVAEIRQNGGISFGRACLKLALQLDRPDAVDALRHAMQGVPNIGRKTTRLLARKTNDTAIAEKAWRLGSYQVASRDPRAGERLARQGKITDVCFLQGFTDAHVALPHAHALIANRRLTHQAFLQATGAPPDIALDWACEGHIKTADYFACVPQPQPAAMQALVEAGRITDEQWLAAGNMSAEAIFARIENGTWTPFHCLAMGWVPDACIQDWLYRGAIDLRTYVNASLRHWAPNKALTRAWVSFACSYPSREALIDTLGVCKTSAPNFQRFNQLAMRLLAAQILGPRAYQTQDTSHLPRPNRCVACYDDVSETIELHKPAACGHAAEFCRDCMEKAVAQKVTCPSADCTTPLTPDDMLRFGCGPLGADTLAHAIVRASRASDAHWVDCPDKDCFGGTSVPPGEIVSYACGGCHKTREGRNFLADIATNRAQVLELISNLAPGGKKHECPTCGVAQEHSSGCAIVKCGICHENFDIFDGPTQLQHSMMGARGQTYVPRTGMLVRAGLYAGLELGSTGHHAPTLLAHVHANAIAGGWMQE